MVTVASFRKSAMSFEGVTESTHFDKTSFRIGKKIFAVLDINNNRAVLKFTAIEQSVFGAYDPTIIYPVPSKWGKLGWTYVELKKVRARVFSDALLTSFCNVAPKKIADKYREQV